ncbi:MAG: HD-like signal output (HDOD) protein, partial [Gammaproteobacteria bacterium]
MAKNEKKNPQGLSDWQDQLQNVVLPANPSVKVAALQKLNASTGNAKNVAAILLEDPGLCLLLMREANQVLQRSKNETNSLSHTISLLGFPYVETLIRRTKDYDKKQFTYFAAYQQQLSTSLHAAYQIEAWAEKNRFWPSGELFWATLFQRAPSWALWYLAGEQMQQLEHLRALNHSSSHSDIESMVFGCRLHELYRLVSRSWNLPKVTQESWQLGVRGTARQWVKLSQVDSEQPG